MSDRIESNAKKKNNNKYIRTLDYPGLILISNDYYYSTDVERDRFLIIIIIIIEDDDDE